MYLTANTFDEPLCVCLDQIDFDDMELLANMTGKFEHINNS